jgi:hypothetical protein
MHFDSLRGGYGLRKLYVSLADKVAPALGFFFDIGAERGGRA